MSEKGKIARALDKSRDLGEVVKLVEELRRAILVYQVSIEHHTSWGGESLTRGTGVTTAIDIQPSRPPDREFVLLVSDSEADLLTGHIKSSFDALLKMRQVREHARPKTPTNTFADINGQR